MLNIKIKGHITSITPKDADRWVEKIDMPEDVVKDTTINDRGTECVVNNRQCKIYKFIWPSGAHYLIKTIDESAKAPKVPKKQKELTGWLIPICRMDNGVPQFKFAPKVYRTEGLAKSGFKYLKAKGYKTMEPICFAIKPPTECDACDKRFTCFTER
jgi:hypothetical protein